MLTVGELKEKIKDIDDNEFVFIVMNNSFAFGESTYEADFCGYDELEVIKTDEYGDYLFDENEDLVMAHKKGVYIYSYSILATELAEEDGDAYER